MRWGIQLAEHTKTMMSVDLNQPGGLLRNKLLTAMPKSSEWIRSNLFNFCFFKDFVLLSTYELAPLQWTISSLYHRYIA